LESGKVVAIIDMAALVFQPHLKTRMGTLRRVTFLGCDRNHNPVDCC
jgi:hypothetical protein